MTGGTTVPSSASLAAALAGLEPPLPSAAEIRLARLFDLLREWKGAGIVGFRTPEELARHYFREALLLQATLPDKGPYLDVGSGGGTPALPLALARGTEGWLLLEPRRTAAAFLEMAVETLGLADRVRIVRQRLKDFLNSPAGADEARVVSAVTMRAVRLQAAEWTMLARRMSPGALVIWPTTRKARQRAALPEGLFDEDFIGAERGVIWTGRPRPE